MPGRVPQEQRLKATPGASGQEAGRSLSNDVVQPAGNQAALAVDEGERNRGNQANLPVVSQNIKSLDSIRFPFRNAWQDYFVSWSQVEETLDALGSTVRDDAAQFIVNYLKKRDELDILGGDPRGRRILVRLYDELTSGSVWGDERNSANIVALALKRPIDPKAFTRLLDPKAAPVIPISADGLTHGSWVRAKLLPSGKIFIKPSSSGEDWNYKKNYPDFFEYQGAEFDPQDILNVVLTDVSPIPQPILAVEFLAFGNANEYETLKKAIEATVAGATLPFTGAGFGGRALLEGAASNSPKLARALSLTSGVSESSMTLARGISSAIEFADVAAIAWGGVSFFIHSIEGGLIRRFGDGGKELLAWVHLLDDLTFIYGFSRIVADVGDLVNAIHQRAKVLRDLARRSATAGGDDVEFANALEVIVDKTDELSAQQRQILEINQQRLAGGASKSTSTGARAPLPDSAMSSVQHPAFESPGSYTGGTKARPQSEGAPVKPVGEEGGAAASGKKGLNDQADLGMGAGLSAQEVSPSASLKEPMGSVRVSTPQTTQKLPPALAEIEERTGTKIYNPKEVIEGGYDWRVVDLPEGFVGEAFGVEGKTRFQWLARVPEENLAMGAAGNQLDLMKWYAKPDQAVDVYRYTFKLNKVTPAEMGKVAPQPGVPTLGPPKFQFRNREGFEVSGQVISKEWVARLPPANAKGRPTGRGLTPEMGEGVNPLALSQNVLPETEAAKTADKLKIGKTTVAPSQEIQEKAIKQITSRPGSVGSASRAFELQPSSQVAKVDQPAPESISKSVGQVSVAPGSEDQITRGAMLAKTKGYKEAEPGYHWVERNGELIYRRNPGHGGPPRIYDHMAQSFKDMPLEMTKGAKSAQALGYPIPEKGYHWAEIDGKLVYKNNPEHGGPERIYDPASNTFRDKPVSIGTLLVEQEAGRLQEKVISDLTGWPKNTQEHATSLGGFEPDYLVKKDPLTGKWMTANSPEEALFVADSKYYDDTTVRLTDQIKGFIEIAGRTKPPSGEKSLILMTNSRATISADIIKWASDRHVKVKQIFQRRSL